jgi:Matrixin
MTQPRTPALLRSWPRWFARRWLRSGVTLASSGALVLALAASPASAYKLSGQRWANVGTDPNAVINQTYSGTGYAWESARNAWNATPTKVWITRSTTEPTTVKLYDTNNSSVAWDGYTTWYYSGSTITSAVAYLNYYYTRNETSSTARGIAAHELGHALGLAHETGCPIMVAYTNLRKNCRVYEPTSDDINGVNAIYGRLSSAGQSGSLTRTSQSGSDDSTGTRAAVTAGSHICVSWNIGYTNLTDMAQDADAIVVGHVKTVAQRTVVDGQPFTDFDYAVDDWVAAPRGDKDLPAAITIHQTGGIRDGQTVEVHGDPLLASGEQGVLFLRRYAPGQYYILGGPTGRLISDGGQLAQLHGASRLDGLSPSQAVTLRAVAQDLGNSLSTRSVLVSQPS